MTELWNYRVVECRVVDGDTLDVTLDLGFHTLRKERLRLARINAPEMKTPQGPVSKTRLAEMLAGKSVIVKTQKDKTDKYGRFIAEVFVDETNVNDALVAGGFAVFQSY